MKRNEIDEYVKRYFDDCILRKRLNEKTVRAYKIDLKQFFEYIGTELEDNHKIINYIYYLNQTYDKHKTVKRKIASIKALYSYLEYEEIIEVTPFRKIRTHINEPKLLPKTIEFDCIKEIFKMLYSDIDSAKSVYEKKQSIRNAAIVEVLFSTGIRISELCNIKKEDISICDRTLKIFGKGSKERILYLGNDSVIEILNKYWLLHQEVINEISYFFVNKFNNKLSDQSVRILLSNIEGRLSQTNHITPHMFRHTFATLLLEKDVDIRYIQKILGHSSISITQIYTHVSYPKQKEILTIKNPRNDIEKY